MVVVPDDEDRFVMAAQDAVKALREKIEQSETISTFRKTFLDLISDFCKAHKRKVAEYYIILPRGEGLEVHVLTHSDMFDVPLSDELTDLHTKLSNFGWTTVVGQVPKKVKENFMESFDQERSLLIYPDEDLE